MSQSGNVSIHIGLDGSSQAEAGLNRVGEAVKSNGKRIDQALVSSNQHFKNVEGSIGSLAKAAAGLYIFGKVADAIHSTVDASLGLQRIQKGLEFATGSAKGAADSFGFLQGEAARLGLDLKSSASEFTKLASAAHGTALQGQATADIFTAISEASTVMGLTAEESGGALNAIQQMISKGTVAAEELRGQLGERLPGAFQLAAKSMGVTTQELGKLLQSGSVVADEFLPKFASELHKTFGTAAETASKQGQAAINRFNTSLFQLQASLGQAVLPALMEVTAHVSALFSQAEKSGELQEAFKGVGSAVVFVVDHLDTLIHVGEAMLAVFAVQKIVSITVAIRGMVLAVQALSLANPIVAALSVSVGVGVIAYHQAKDAAEDFNNEAQNIKEAEKKLTEYSNKVDALTIKFQKLGEQWKDKSPFPNVAAPAGTPANPTAPGVTAKPLTSDQVTDLAKLQKEANAARLEVMYEGAALARAQENADHIQRVKALGGVHQLLEAEAVRHRYKLAVIAKQEAEDSKTEAQKLATENAKRRTDETEAIKNGWSDHQGLLSQIADYKVSAMDDGFAKQLAESARQEEKEKAAFAASEGYKVASAQNIQDILTGIEHSGAQRRKKIRSDEALSAKQTFVNQAQFAGEMVNLLLSGVDNFYAHSKKNALLHKALNIGIIESEGAVAAIRAYSELGPLFGSIAAGLIEFKTQSAVYKVSQQKFAGGGIIQGPSTYGDSVPVLANAKEMILNQSQQAGLFSFIKGGSQGSSGGGNNVSVTYAPVYPSGADSYGPSFTEAARRDKVEFGRFMEKELKAKGYVN